MTRILIELLQSILPKVRRIKCDEGKPACNRCTGTGRKCDGYAIQPCGQQALTVHETPIRLKVSISTPLRSGLFKTENERQGFEFFQSQTREQLKGASAFDAWFEIVLQASQADTVLRNAAIAIGSLHKHIRVDNASSSECEESSKYQHLALMKYQRAVNELRKKMCNSDDQTADAVLLSCCLFILFEFLQGNDTAAINHIKGGLAILSEAEDSSIVYNTHRKSQYRSNMRQIFTILDYQASVWLNLQPIQPGLIEERALEEPHDPSIMSLTGFPDLDRIGESLFWQTNRVYIFLRSFAISEGTPGVSEVSREEALHTQENLIQDLEKWRTALHSFHEQLTPNLTIQDHSTLLKLHMNYLKVSTMLSAALSPKPAGEPYLISKYRPYTPKFCQIVSLARKALPLDIMCPTNPRDLGSSLHVPAAAWRSTRTTISSTDTGPTYSNDNDGDTAMPAFHLSSLLDSSPHPREYSRLNPRPQDPTQDSPAPASSSATSSHDTARPTLSPSITNLISTPKTLTLDVKLARLQSQSRGGLYDSSQPNPDPSMHVFNFYLSTIQPLYFVACNCSEEVTRDAALQLLETPKRREGAWDSAAMARIARRRIRDGEVDGKGHRWL